MRDEAAVELDATDVETTDVDEAREAGAEVVEVDQAAVPRQGGGGMNAKALGPSSARRVADDSPREFGNVIVAVRSGAPPGST